MGLDMYLNRHPYGEVKYWRKANAIHNWFVVNVQNGVDDCDSYSVTPSQLLQLRDACLKVAQYIYSDGGRLTLQHDEEALQVVRETLPTRCGFFFGSLDYDEWYCQNVLDTLKMINTEMNCPTFEKLEYIYQASW